MEAKGLHHSEPNSQPFRGTCSLASCSCSAESPEWSTGRAGWKKSLTVLKACRNPDGVHTRSASIPFRTCSHSLSPSLPLSFHRPRILEMDKEENRRSVLLPKHRRRSNFSSENYWRRSYEYTEDCDEEEEDGSPARKVKMRRH